MFNKRYILILCLISHNLCLGNNINESRNINGMDDLNVNVNININYTSANVNNDSNHCKNLIDTGNNCAANGTIAYYEHNNAGGKSETVNLTRQCHNVKPLFAANNYSGISYINTNGNCIRLYISPNCDGPTYYFIPGMKSICDALVPNCGLEDRVKSMRLC